MQQLKNVFDCQSIEELWELVSSYQACLVECDDEDGTCVVACMTTHLEPGHPDIIFTQQAPVDC